MQIAASDQRSTRSDLERAVNQRLVQIYDHADLPGVFRLGCGQQRLHLDLEIERAETMSRQTPNKAFCSNPSGISEIRSSRRRQNRATGEATHLGDGPVLLHQQGGVVVDRLRLRLVPTQAAEKAGEEASAAGLLGGHGGRGACGRGRRRRRSEASKLLNKAVVGLLADPMRPMSIV